MKKFLLCALFAIMFNTSFAYKSYITVYCKLDGTEAWVSGDVPEGMKREYSAKDFNKKDSKLWMGDLLNLLAKKGYVVSRMDAYCSTGMSHHYAIYLLEKEIPE